jgi:hypothetical protein
MLNSTHPSTNTLCCGVTAVGEFKDVSKQYDATKYGVKKPVSFSQVIATEPSGPVVGYIFLLPVFGADPMRMVSKFVIEHLSDNKVTEHADPTQRTGRQSDSVYEHLNPSVLSSPCRVVKSNHMLPPYAATPSR